MLSQRFGEVTDKDSILTDYHDLLRRVDAVSIVVPTSSHYQIARTFLEHGSQVLVEKPIASSLDEAQSLIDLAK